MKKLFLLLASATLLFAGCTKEINEVGAGDGETVKVSVSTMLENAEPATKAIWDNDGNAALVDHWIMEVYDAQGILFDRQEKEGQSGLTNTFDVVLIKNQSYKFAFWADTKGMYNTDDLRAVKTVSRKAGRDGRDAFFCEKDYKSTKSETLEAKLYRPFHQINIVTTDLDKIYKQMEKAGTTGDYAKFIPTALKLKGETYNELNVLTGAVSNVQEYELSLASCYADYSAHAAKTTIFMDYGFATPEKELKDLDFVFTSNGEEIAYNFTNIPLQRNYRTNILGNFLSNDATWNVEIIPIWDGDGTDVEADPYLVNYSEAGSIADANEKLEAGENAVSIENPDDTDTNSIILPASQDGNDIFLKLSGTEGKTVKVELGDGAQGPANLYVTADKGSLDINCPNSHVEVNGGEYEAITASTSASTLVVGKDVTIATLYVRAGNVEIHGKVASFTRENGVKAEMYASDRATLVNYINWAKTGDTAGLECDIDLAGENWTPLRQENRYTATFDGQGHTISNMTIESDWAYGVGFFSDMTGGAVIKNFTMDNASVANTTADKGNMYGIISGYAYGNATFENITVKNSNIHAFGKVAAILGMAADANGTTVVKNCKVENTQIIGCYNVANYVGLVQNAIVLEGCTSTNVTKSLGGRYGEDSYVTFDNVKVINNDEQNPKYVLSSGKYWEYAPGQYFAAFADCYNDIHYCEWKALDGSVDALVFNTTDAPELKDLEPVATIGTAKYYDLPSAFAAIQEGQTLEILQAGEYTIPNLPNITVSGKVEGVVFNCVGSGNIASISNGATFKNVTMNFGQSGYHGFQGAGHIIMKDCTLNGMFFSYGDMTFNDCEFNQTAEEYNMWTYGGNVTYDGCTFNSKGKFLNVYRESATEYNVVAKNCVFNTSKANKPALNIKETCNATFLKYNVTITDCSCNDLQKTVDLVSTATKYVGSPIWQVDDRKAGETAINVTVDGIKVYPFCSKDADGNYHIVNADGLLQFRDLYAAGKVAHTAKVYVDNDIDFTGKTWEACDWHADGTKKGFALFDGQNHTIKNFTISGQGMFSRWACTANIGATPYFKDIVFDGAKNVTSTLNVSLFCGQCYQNAKIENVTIKNSQIEGTYKVAPFVGSVYDENPTGSATLTLKDCKVENTTVKGTSFDFDICGMVAWVYEGNAEKIAFEGNNVVKDVTLYTPGVNYQMCAKIYHNGDVAYDEAANVTVTNVNVVNGQ